MKETQSPAGGIVREAETPAEICGVIGENLVRVEEALANGHESAAWSWLDQIGACVKEAKAMLPEPHSASFIACNCGHTYAESLENCPICGNPTPDED